MKTLLVFTLLAAVAARAYGDCVCGATSGGGEVNVRTCASTTCAIVGALFPGECSVWQANDGLWHRITFNGQTAYVHGDYTSGPQACSDGSTMCTNRLCSSFATNERRACDAYGCGNYGASRSGGRLHGGWDVKCNMGGIVYAPFGGTVTRKAYPYGDGSCCDTGFEIVGSGSWSGHTVMMFYCEPDRVTIPQTVTKGQAVATHQGLHCGCYATTMTDHTHYQMTYNGAAVDPASWLFCDFP